MSVKTAEQLVEDTPIVETDDYAIGFMMVQEIATCTPELKAYYFASWAARLREYYVGLGRTVGYSEWPNKPD